MMTSAISNAIAATILVLLATGCSPGSPKGKTGSECVGSDIPGTVIAIDVSSEFSERQILLLKAILGRTWRRTEPDGRLTVYTLDGRPEEMLPILDFCKESRPSTLGITSGPKTKEFKGFEDRDANRMKAMDELVGRLGSNEGVPKSSHGSRLYEWLKAVPAAVRTQGARSLIFVSDLRQFSPAFRNSNLPANGVSLSGYAVDVVVLGDGRAVPEPWRRLLANSGAASLNFHAEALPGSLLYAR